MSDWKARSNFGGLLIPGGLLIGLGIGIAVGQTAPGVLVGLGAGFVGWALLRLTIR